MATGFQTNMIRRGLQGDTSPPDGLPDAGAFRAPVVADVVHQLMVATKEQLGDQLLSAFNATYDEMDALLASLGPSDWNQPCYHPGAVIPVSGFVNLRLMELYVHGWDMRSRLEPTVHLPPESWPVLLDLLPHFLSYMVVPTSEDPQSLCYRFVLSENMANSTDLVVADGTICLMAAGHSSAHATFACDTETFLLLMWGRLAFDTAIAEGRLSITGNHSPAADFGRWYKGF